MQTQCISNQLEFQGLCKRKVVGEFSGGNVTSDAGALLLREVEASRQIIKKFADCFDDYRDPDLIEHTVCELVGQRVYGIALGYEDLTDHDDIRKDPLLATLIGKVDPTGDDRRRKQDKGFPLSGKSTLNRLELTPSEVTSKNRYKKIVYRGNDIDRFFVDVFVDTHKQPPEEIILDLDATDDQIHGNQEGRFYHGYYRHYCYLPLYIFCGDELLCARLRQSNIDASAGTVEELERITKQLREYWPDVKIIIRADSGFARDGIMTWCEANGVDYILGLAKNKRLLKRITKKLERARRKHLRTGKSTRYYHELRYRTLKTWSRKRRVVAKAEHLEKGSNPRFVVTSLSKQDYRKKQLYEDLYCARGDMENRIKEQQMGLFADRTSSQTMRANQLRLWLSSVAYVIMNELRRIGLSGTKFARAQMWTIRNKLLKMGAIVRVSVRRVFVRFSSAYPYQVVFDSILHRLKLARL